MKIDRRIVRTRESLRQGLVRLMLTREYDAIQINDLLAEAQVSRAAFYAHFASKDDLLVRSLGHLKRDLDTTAAERSDASERLWRCSARYFAHLEEYRRLQEAIRGGRADRLAREAIDRIWTEVLDQRILAGWRREPVKRFAVGQLTHAFSMVSVWWLDSRAGADEAQAHLRELTERGPLQALVGATGWGSPVAT